MVRVGFARLEGFAPDGKRLVGSRGEAKDGHRRVGVAGRGGRAGLGVAVEVPAVGKSEREAAVDERGDALGGTGNRAGQRGAVHALHRDAREVGLARAGVEVEPDAGVAFRVDVSEEGFRLPRGRAEGVRGEGGVGRRIEAKSETEGVAARTPLYRDAEVGGRRELRAGNGELNRTLAGVGGEPEERAAVLRDELRRALPLAPAGEVVADAARQHAAARAHRGMVDGREALREVDVEDRLGRQREADGEDEAECDVLHGGYYSIIAFPKCVLGGGGESWYTCGK